MSHKEIELLEETYTLKDKIESYLYQAEIIDNKAIEKSDNPLPLDSIPFGEERLRLRTFPQQLENIVELLESDKASDADLSNIEESISEITSTLDDCTELPVSSQE